MLSLIDALSRPHPCHDGCFRVLELGQRTRAITALYTLDDALRGHGYSPIYDLHGDLLWREAQRRADPSYRGVAVRFGECIYRRLLGAMLHEVIHASLGDPSKANYGIPFGLPYAVPEHVAPRDEAAYLEPFNFDEARAFIGIWIIGPARFGIDWRTLNARDWGTYGFVGGNALLPAPRGHRSVGHVDAEHHAARYHARAQVLEERAREWMQGERLQSLIARIDEAAARGRATRARAYPPPEQLACLEPRDVGRNDPCPCASGKKVKACCGLRPEMRRAMG